jgi:hypothetical protein
MTLIKDSAQRDRVNRDTRFGIHPQAAERLKAFGIDAEERSQQIAAMHIGTARRRPAGLALAAIASAPKIELSLDPSDVRLQPLLNQAALMFEDYEFLADAIAPVQLVGERSAQYFLEDKDNVLHEFDAEIGQNADGKEIDDSLATDTFRLVSRALLGKTLRATANENPSVVSRARTVERVRRRMMRLREIRTAKLFGTAANYPAANRRVLGGTANWNGGSTADPIADILYCQENIDAPVTDMVMSDLMWHAAQQNAQLKAILASQFDNKGVLRPADMSLYFGVPNFHISRAEYIAKGATTRSRIWSTGSVMLFNVNSSEQERTFARTHRLNIGAGGFSTQTWFDPKVGEQGADWTKLVCVEAEKLIDNTRGAIITGART